MATVLKVDEWKSGSGHWYVSDVHTWRGWRDYANILGAETLDDFILLLKTKYKVKECEYYPDKDFLLFKWTEKHYKEAHQFKLDVNRIARKKNYLVERSF